jgi:hypothetical protein
MEAQRRVSPTLSPQRVHYVLSLRFVLIAGFYCKQAKHCESGMVFAINPPTSGEKTFQAYKALAMGGSSTVIATAITSTLVSVTAPPPPPAAYSPPPMIVPGTNIATDGQCQCVCNIDVANGYLSGKTVLTLVSSIPVYKVLEFSVARSDRLPVPPPFS